MDQIRAVVVQCRSFEYKLNEEEESAIKYLELLPTDSEVNEEVAAQIGVLWKSESIKKSYENRTNLSVVDSSAYFFDALDRISKQDYEPTEKDILLVRTPTTGIVSATFEINKHIFNVHDAGGQVRHSLTLSMEVLVDFVICRNARDQNGFIASTT